VLGRIKSVPVEKVPTTRITAPSGEIIESPPRQYSIGINIELKDAVAGNPENLYSTIYEEAERNNRERLAHFTDLLDKICPAFGNSIDVKGQQFSFEHVLKFLETTEISFDEQGNPDLSNYVLFSQKTGLPVEIPAPTEEQFERLKALMERKRIEFNDRRRYRQLS